MQEYSELNSRLNSTAAKISRSSIKLWLYERSHLLSGWFVYLETSAPRLNKAKARLVSSELESSSNCLEFYYHMLGDHVNALNVYLRETGVVDVLIWTLSKDQGDAWKKAQVPLMPSSGQKFQVRSLFFSSKNRFRKHPCQISPDQFGILNPVFTTLNLARHG